MFSYSNWSVLTVNFLVVVYLALGGVTLSAILHLAGARWRYEIRFLASSLFALFRWLSCCWSCCSPTPMRLSHG